MENPVAVLYYIIDIPNKMYILECNHDTAGRGEGANTLSFIEYVCMDNRPIYRQCTHLRLQS